MNQLDTLARLTFDTLPINIAVLDETGTILFTKRAGREFAGAGPTEQRLTDRQRRTLQNANVGGFFDWPRETAGEELAASMDISPSTYHQHLRTAERNVLDALFED